MEGILIVNKYTNEYAKKRKRARSSGNEYVTSKGAVQHYFPVRGHSFLPCDRDFALIKKTIRKQDRIYSMRQYSGMIMNSRKTQNAFQVKIIEHENIIDVKEWWPHFKKNRQLLLIAI